MNSMSFCFGKEERRTGTNIGDIDYVAAMMAII